MKRSPKHLRLVAALRRPAVYTSAALQRFGKICGGLTGATQALFDSSKRPGSVNRFVDDAKVLGAVVLFAVISILASWPAFIIGGP